MEAAQIVPLRTAQPSVRVDGDTVIVDRLHLTDRGLAGFVEQRPAGDRPELAERALRIGLHALQDAGTSLDVELVRREFDSLLDRSATVNERAASELDRILRTNFADGDGRLPRTLERFLGDRGQLTKFVSELFDETRRDSAIGRMKSLLGSYFDGDASRLAQLLDPTRIGSPLHQFRVEIGQHFEKLNDRLTAIEAAYAARSGERARSAAKGEDFEDLLEQMLADAVRSSGDVIERTAALAGDVSRSRKGDFVLSLNPAWSNGLDVRVVVEAKDRGCSWREIRDELTEARRNRGAAVALAIFTPQHAPSGVAPFDVRYGHVFCVIDPQAPDPVTLEAGLRLARLHALASVATQHSEVDAPRALQAVSAIRAELDELRRLKTQLTSIRNTAVAVTGGLDRLRDQILARVADAEACLQPVGSPGSGQAAGGSPAA